MDKKISPNFYRHEFACKCGCGFNTVDVELLTLCETVRQINGHKPIEPNCGCRCQKHNIEVGGSQGSQHLKGRAADLPCDYPEIVYKELCKRYPDEYGFGLYGWGVHVDSRSKNSARWRG